MVALEASLCGNKPPPGLAAQQVRPSPHFQINCLIIAGLKSRPATTCRARWRNPSYWTSRATASSLDRADTQLIGTPPLQVFTLSPLEEAGDHLRTHRHGLLEWPQGLQTHSITLSLRHSARPRCCPARDWALASAGEQRGTRERWFPSCETEESPPVSTLGRAVHLLLHKISTSSSSFKLILGDETDRTEAFSITTGHVHSLNITKSTLLNIIVKHLESPASCKPQVEIP